MTDEKAKYIANFIAEWVYQHLISTTSFGRIEALRAAANAGDKAVQSLQQDLREEVSA